MPQLRDKATSELIEDGDLYALVLKAEELGFESVLFDGVGGTEDTPFDPQPWLDEAHRLQEEVKTLNKAPKKNADHIAVIQATLGSLGSQDALLSTAEAREPVGPDTV